MILSAKFLIHSINNSIKKRGLQVGDKVQKFIDSETIRKMEPYTPLDTGFLKDDAPKLSTVIGSGKVIQNAPYAKKQYYTNSGRYQTGQRGKLWFERMKANHKKEILKGAAKIAGGKADDN